MGDYVASLEEDCRVEKHPPRLLDKNCDSEMQEERIGTRPHQASLEAVAIYLHLAG